MKKYTAIYVLHWMQGSYMQHDVQMRRINKGEKETVLDMLKREYIDENTIFLFKGWPKLQDKDAKDDL